MGRVLYMSGLAKAQVRRLYIMCLCSSLKPKYKVSCSEVSVEYEDGSVFILDVSGIFWRRDNDYYKTN